MNPTFESSTLGTTKPLEIEKMTQKEQGSLLQKEVDTFIAELDKLESSAERLEKMLEYMQKQLSHGQIKPLNRFWKMREYCLARFKENLTLPKRIHLWETYRGIVTEIVRLKEVLTEKSLYHREEIEKAIASIEKDLSQLDQIIASSPEVEVPPKCPCLEKNKELYQNSQKELNVINNLAKQLNGLKSEVIELEIPYREKQTILDKLHALSDVVFPKRRDLLTLISKKYCDDIHYFMAVNFEKKELKFPLFDLKDQIKALQAFAKVLSLNVSAFSQSREKLSKCWDKIRTFEKAQKKIKDEQKATFNENETRLKDRIESLKKDKAGLSKKDFENEVSRIDQSINQVELHKQQRKKLKELLALIDENSVANDESSKEENAFIQIQREILNIEEKAKHWDFFTLLNESKRVHALCQNASTLDVHQNKILRGLFSMRMHMMEKLLEEVENSVDVEELSIQVEEFKKEMRADMEKYRRALNTSNQSIEKAMLYNELLTQTKIKLQEFEKKTSKSVSEAK